MIDFCHKYQQKTAIFLLHSLFLSLCLGLLLLGSGSAHQPTYTTYFFLCFLMSLTKKNMFHEFMNSLQKWKCNAPKCTHCVTHPTPSPFFYINCVCISRKCIEFPSLFFFIFIFFLKHRENALFRPHFFFYTHTHNRYCNFSLASCLSARHKVKYMLRYFFMHFQKHKT